MRLMLEFEIAVREGLILGPSVLPYVPRNPPVPRNLKVL
jgi:hypothetical protein